MRTLRLVGAKGRQKAIIVYWGTLETGKVDDKTNMTVWSTYTGGKNAAETKSIRYLLRFALVDVKTGNWVTYSPTNTNGNLFSRHLITRVQQVLRPLK
ncbi:hypothetical protein [Budvicia aquatica]|nr:hypothetical protein [Budvicia aquatica]